MAFFDVAGKGAHDGDAHPPGATAIAHEPLHLRRQGILQAEHTGEQCLDLTGLQVAMLLVNSGGLVPTN